METPADIFRVTLLAPQRKSLATALRRRDIGHGCEPPVSRRDDGSYAAVVFVCGDALSRLSIAAGMRLAEVCNISARLRATPTEL